jgi:DNA-directed RNA polymerase
LTLKAISTLFTGAHHIKKWLINCAKLIGDLNNPVGWITPLGLPVVQPYRTLSKLDAVSTVSQLLKVPTNN